MRIRIGIDPGITGALALLDIDSGEAHVHDMPTMPLTGKKLQVNCAELGRMLRVWKSAAAETRSELTAFVEAQQGHGMVWTKDGPRAQGGAGQFNFGVSYGAVLAALAVLDIPAVLVRPAAWKKRAGLPGKAEDRDRARTLAQQLYPGAPLSRKKDLGRADALLIARFGR